MEPGGGNAPVSGCRCPGYRSNSHLRKSNLIYSYRSL